MDDASLRDRFVGAMSFAASTVNVVTTQGPAGCAGVTVSAMSSVSADGPKPTLLVCVHHESATAPAIAGRPSDQLKDKFDCADWTMMGTGAPRVVDPLVAFDCRLVSAQRMGTHHVFIGEVEAVFNANGGTPLIYYNRAYGKLSDK